MNPDLGAFVCKVSWVGHDGRLRADRVFYRYGQLFMEDGRLVESPGFIRDRDGVGAVEWPSAAMRAWYYQNADHIPGGPTHPPTPSGSATQQPPIVAQSGSAPRTGRAMGAVVAAILGLAILASLAFAVILVIGPGGGSQAATFVSYEAIPTGDADSGSLLGTYSSRELTGYALVDLRDGTRVKAECPIQGIAGGDTVTVKRNSDGKWAVTGRR